MKLDELRYVQVTTRFVPSTGGFAPSSLARRTARTGLHDAQLQPKRNVDM